MTQKRLKDLTGIQVLTKILHHTKSDKSLRKKSDVVKLVNY